MDNTIRKALKKKRELMLEVDRLERFIVTYEELTGEKVQRDEMVSSVDNGDKSTQNKEQTQKNEPKKRRNNIKKLLDVSERLIREAGRPLTRSEIAEGMDRLNVVVHAADKPKYLGTLLWRNPDRFVSVDDGYINAQMAEQTGAQQVSDKNSENDALQQLSALFGSPDY